MMSVRRLPLLWAFAGGCLSTAALIGAWRADAGTHAATKHGSRARAASRPADPAPDEPRAAADEPAAPTATVRDDLAHAPASSVAQATAQAVAAPASDDAGLAAEQGSSVADVLARLEAQYRQGLATTSNAAANVGQDPANSATVAGQQTGAPPQAIAIAIATANAALPPAPARDADAAQSAPAQPTAVAAPAHAALPASTPAPVAMAPRAEEAAAAPPVAPASTTNVNIGSIHQGDVYNVQQVAVMPYVPYMAFPPYGVPYGYPNYGGHGGRMPYAAAVAPPGPAPLGPPQLPVSAPPFPSFLSSLTNPDNPWGTSHAPRSR